MYNIISQVPRVDEKNETFQVLASQEDSNGNENLFILTVGFGEIEAILDEMNADYTYIDLIQDSKMAINFIEFIFDWQSVEEFEAVPYRQPVSVRYLGVTTKITDSLIQEEHPYGFIPVEEYHKLNY